MKKLNYLNILVLTLATLGTGCTQQIDDPVFDYNLKSAQLIETNNDFGLELLNQVIKNEDSPNIMISPASVSIALGMAYNGAETTTRDAFEEVLNYEGLSREEINEITKELIRVLLTNVKGNLLEIANSMWYDEGFPVEEEFINLNSNYYDAEVREIDFRTADAVKTINQWVSNKTHGKIDEIIDAIDPAMMMILINAIYFNCVWEVEFDADDTYDQAFYKEDGSLFGEVEMMELESTFNASFTDEFTAVELPYKNKKFSMFLFLPAEGSTVNGLLGQLDGSTWNSWLEGFSERKEFTVSMPKFKFEYERSMAEDLKAMGLEIAFTDLADFSGISPVDLLISDVIHKTYIDVNEEGTEAAAVTAIVFETTSIGPTNGIRLDRPYVFAITENSSKSIVFMGKVMEPSYK
jgi:serpin B